MVLTSHRPDFLETSRVVDAVEQPRPRPLAEAVIGLVVFKTHRGEWAEAILDGQGCWRCPKLPVLDRVLNILYEPKRVGPTGAPFGQEALVRVAAWLKGAVVAKPASAGDNPPA